MIAALRRTTWLGLLLVLLLQGESIRSALAQAPSEAQSQAPAIEDAAKDSLRDQNFPWYDAKSDSEKPIGISADPDETGQRDSNWLASGNWQTKSNRRFTPGSFNWLSTTFQALFWILVAGLLFGVSYVVILAFMKMDARQLIADGGEVEDEEEDDKTRIENLPFQLKKATSDFLSEARACYDRGEYNDAIIYLYSHQLIALDRRQAIYLTKGKTNRQYLRELRERPALEKILESTVLLFEEAFFGHHLIAKAQIDRCFAELPHFDRELERVTT